MHPIYDAIKYLRDKGLTVQEVVEPFLRLYNIPGYPELTTGQVMDVARQHGWTPTN